MTMHRFPKYITAAVVLLAAALTAAAIPQKPYPPRLVNDFAGILDQTGKAMLEKSTEYNRTVNLMELNDGNLKTTVKALDNNPLIPTQSALMKTAYTFFKGVEDSGDTDKKAGGFAPTAEAKTIHWLIVPETAPISVCKQDLVRTFDPQTYQKANAWHVDYRRYFDLFVPDNKAKGLFACVSAAAAG